MDESNTHMRTTIDALLSDAIRLRLPMLFTQADGVIVDVNLPLLDLLGYERGQVLNRHCSVLLAQPEAASAWPCLLGALSTKKSVTSRCAKPMVSRSGWM